MYLVRLHYRNAKQNKDGKFEVKSRNGSIPKWKILSSENKTLEKLRLFALSILNPSFLPNLDISPRSIFNSIDVPLHLEFEIFYHPETEGRGGNQHHIVGSGLDINPDWTHRRLTRGKCDRLSPDGIFHKITLSRDPAKHFLLAYGPRFSAHDGADDFDFTHPHFVVTRLHTLFHPRQNLTDPVAFLERLAHKGIRYKKFTSSSILNALRNLLSAHLNVDSETFRSLLRDPKWTWRRFSSPQRRMMLPLLDICRHLSDAFPKAQDALGMPGVIIFHRPDIFVDSELFPAWIRLIDSLTPNMQFMITLSEESKRAFPDSIRRKRLVLQNISPPAPENKFPSRLPKKPVLLIQVDGRLPNLALMKLSRYYKEMGKNVVLARKRAFIKRADEVFASCIFNCESSKAHVRALKQYYGDNIRMGGSGIDLALRLPEEVEELPADYDLCPELEDRALGFITRGCPHKCPFCVVPEKEGSVRKVADLPSLLGGNRKKLILLDDNLLAHEDSEDLLVEMAGMGLRVNFTQTLDFRYVNKKKADLLRRIECMNTKFTRPNYYFSLNDTRRIPLISEKYGLFGFKSRDNVEFICMYGFDTTLAQDVERFRFLRSLPGAYVFVQQYQPIGTDAPSPDDSAFFDNDAERLIDELITIVFTQNMKSMEKYYKWLGRKYVLAFGKLHDGLVDTIFRYNNRCARGEYIATLAGTRRR